MRLTNELLQLGVYNNIINESQCNILNIEYPPTDNWKNIVLDREISTTHLNLFIMLCGDFSLDIQKQIIKNYNILSKIYNKKEKSKENKRYLKE